MRGGTTRRLHHLLAVWRHRRAAVDLRLARRRAGLSDKAHPLGARLRDRRRTGQHRARRRSAAHGADRAVGRARQPSRRERHHRHRNGRELEPRRLHAARHLGFVRRQSERPPQAPLRLDQELRAGDESRELARDAAARERVLPCADRAAADRDREEARKQARIRLFRRRQRDASRSRAFQCAHRDAARSRPLQRRRPRHERAPRERDPGDVHESRRRSSRK